MPREFKSSNLSNLNNLPRIDPAFFRRPIDPESSIGQEFHSRFGHLPLQDRITLSQGLGRRQKPRRQAINLGPDPRPLSDLDREILGLQAELTHSRSRPPRSLPAPPPLEQRITEPTPVHWHEPIIPLGIAFGKNTTQRAAVIKSRAQNSLTRLEVFWKYPEQLTSLSERDRVYIEQLKDQVTWLVDFSDCAAQWPPERLTPVYFGLNTIRRFAIKQVRKTYFKIILDLTNVDPIRHFSAAHIPHRVFFKGDKYKDEDWSAVVEVDHPLGW